MKIFETRGIGVILAGGKGTRLFPLTKVINKHLLPVCGKPMIYCQIDKLLQMGLTKIYIVTNSEYVSVFKKQLKGEYKNIIVLGQKKPDGIASALYVVKKYVKTNFVVLLGDNIFTHIPVKEYIDFSLMKDKACVFLKKVKNPKDYGVAKIVKNKIFWIKEKPKNPDSNYCVTGIYFYPPSVFEIIEKIKPSVRGEYEISTVNNCFIKQGKMNYKFLNGDWFDVGTLDQYIKINKEL